MRYLVIIIIFLIPICIYGQGEAELSNEGIIFPRYTTAQRNSLTPVKGQVIYNITSNTLNAYDGIIWKDYQGPTPWISNAGDIHYSSGQVGINTPIPLNQLHVVSDGTTSNMVRLDGAITPANRDILEIIVDAGTGDNAQFIEMQRGTNIVASINTDGAAKFKSVGFEDFTTQTTAAHGSLAFGAISTTGGISSGSGNYTVSWSVTNSRYEITIAGEPYHFTDYAAVVTPNSSNAISFRTSSSNGKLLVYIRNSAGTSIQSNFHFIVFKP